MKNYSISNMCVCILGIVFLFMLWNNYNKEHYRSGAQIQLMTSRPYYGWYDYVSRWGGYYNNYNPWYWGSWGSWWDPRRSSHSSRTRPNRRFPNYLDV